MNENRKIRVAITHGDTNGIGYELIFKTFAEPEILELCTPIIYGSPKIAAYHSKALDLEANFSIINNAKDAKDGRVNLLTVFDEELKVELGVPTEESGNAGLKAIDRALEDYRDGLFDVLVTAPMTNNDQFHFSGQSRYIEDHMEAEDKGLTILISDKMRVALATRNLPLKQVTELITKDTIKQKAKQLFRCMQRDMRISTPRIAILALNPKAGDNGLLGTEEQEILIPTINELVDEHVTAFGPFATDKFFGSRLYEEFDAVLAMYYDQGLAPFRSLSIEDGVNYTAGLPMVRTAPEMNSIFDIAGKGIVDENPLRHAIYTAIDIFRNRASYDEPLKNPLQKLYREHRDDNDKTRFSIPKKREDRMPHINKPFENHHTPKD
jgi:4-hydroxythreonine-4-phosphate dehydrogenase